MAEMLVRGAKDLLAPFVLGRTALAARGGEGLFHR
jgi:hypothetical protein